MRQTGIYPECSAASAQPHLTSAVKAGQSDPAVAGGLVWITSTSKRFHFQQQAWRPLSRQLQSHTKKKKNIQKRMKLPILKVFLISGSVVRGVRVQGLQLCTHSAASQQRCQRFCYLFVALRVCSVHTALLVSICRWKRHKWSSSFIYKKHFFVFSSPTWANPRVTLSKPGGDPDPTTLRWTQHHATLKERCVSHPPTIYGYKCTFNIRCFLQKLLAGDR